MLNNFWGNWREFCKYYLGFIIGSFMMMLEFKPGLLFFTWAIIPFLYWFLPKMIEGIKVLIRQIRGK